MRAVARGAHRPRVIGRYRCAPTGNDQTSLILSVADEAGAIHSLIEPLARHGVSMKRFESRPARQSGWEYNFYIDLIGLDSGVDEASLATLSLNDCEGCNPGGPKQLGTPISQLSGRPGHLGFDAFCGIAASWGQP